MSDPNDKYAVRKRQPEILLFSIVLGLALGAGFFTFIYARGYSYLTDDPAACVNCHVMEDHFAAWMKSSHQNVAVCNDCHTPSGLVSKYVTKAINGFRHSVAFTTGDFPDPLLIRADNLEVTEGACQKCHRRLTETITPGHHMTGDARPPADLEAPPSCIRCHRSVGHWVR